MAGSTGRIRAWSFALQLTRRLAGGLARAVADGTLDLALLSLPADPQAGVALRRLAREPLVLICAPDHPLASAGEIPLDALGGEIVIDFPAGWGTRTVIDRAFAAAEIDRQVAFEVPYHDVAVRLVRNGLGVAFIPRRPSPPIPRASRE